MASKHWRCRSVPRSWDWGRSTVVHTCQLLQASSSTFCSFLQVGRSLCGWWDRPHYDVVATLDWSSASSSHGTTIFTTSWPSSSFYTACRFGCSRWLWGLWWIVPFGCTHAPSTAGPCRVTAKWTGWCFDGQSRCCTWFGWSRWSRWSTESLRRLLPWPLRDHSSRSLVFYPDLHHWWRTFLPLVGLERLLRDVQADSSTSTYACQWPTFSVLDCGATSWHSTSQRMLGHCASTWRSSSWFYRPICALGHRVSCGDPSDYARSGAKGEVAARAHQSRAASQRYWFVPLLSTSTKSLFDLAQQQPCRLRHKPDFLWRRRLRQSSHSTWKPSRGSYSDTLFGQCLSPGDDSRRDYDAAHFVPPWLAPWTHWPPSSATISWFFRSRWRRSSYVSPVWHWSAATSGQCSFSLREQDLQSGQLLGASWPPHWRALSATWTSLFSHRFWYSPRTWSASWACSHSRTVPALACLLCSNNYGWCTRWSSYGKYNLVFGYAQAAQLWWVSFGLTETELCQLDQKHCWSVVWLDRPTLACSIFSGSTSATCNTPSKTTPTTCACRSTTSWRRSGESLFHPSCWRCDRALAPHCTVRTTSGDQTSSSWFCGSRR